jgi:predicted nucleotidyltransferase component of viral defense system
MNEKPKPFLAKARSWAAKNKLHGPQAFLRFVMLVFVERLNQASDEFIFKGGNLLWVYIKTPRATVDVDFVTRSLADSASVREAIEAVCSEEKSSIAFKLKAFVEVSTQGSLGAAVSISYRTAEGQENAFDLDIVYATPSDITTITSPISALETIQVVTIENIIADKLAAAQRYRSGNSRMKDFDDLWRISKVNPDPISWSKLQEILSARTILSSLDTKWVVPQMEKSWQSHAKRNPGLPADLKILIQEVNEWLQGGLSFL